MTRNEADEPTTGRQFRQTRIIWGWGGGGGGKNTFQCEGSPGFNAL